MIENYELRLPGRNPARCYVHKTVAGYVSLSTESEDLLCRPESLKPYRRMVTRREKVGEQETFRADRHTLEAIKIVVPIHKNVEKDETPSPEVLGRPIVVGDPVVLSVNGEPQARGRLEALGALYVMIGDELHRWRDDTVISRDV